MSSEYQGVAGEECEKSFEHGGGKGMLSDVGLVACEMPEKRDFK